MKVMMFLLSYVMCVIVPQISQAQSTNEFPSVIQVGKNITTMLVFPAPIKDADRGSADIIIQPVNKVRNVLKVKAVRNDFSPTNLTVFTLDDKIYTVAVVYSSNPTEIPYNFTNAPLNSPPCNVRGLNDAEIEQNATVIAGLKPSRKSPSQSVYSMKCNLTGIYAKDGILFFQFYVKNNSNIPFNLDLLRCYHRDKVRSKRSSQMEKEVIPRYFNSKVKLDAHQGSYYVAAFDQFTIANKKIFSMEFFEKNGDRHMSLKLKGRHILKAQVLK